MAGDEISKGRGGDATRLIPFQRVLAPPDNQPTNGATGVTPDGNYRKIIRCGSLNFLMRDLYEQRAILDVWCEMLDNLDFPIQILAHSKQLDPDAYLRQYELQLRKPSLSASMRVMIQDHVRWQRERVIKGGLLNREFYIVVPHLGEDQALLERPSDFVPGFAFARELLNNAERSEQKEFNPTAEDLDTAEVALKRRMNYIQGYLDRMGIWAYPLSVAQLRNLLFEIFQPARSEQYKLQTSEWSGQLFPRVIDDDDLPGQARP